MKSIYIVRKYILAKSIKDALEKERKSPAQDCWLDENSTKAYTESLLATDKKKTGFIIKKQKYGK